MSDKEIAERDRLQPRPISASSGYITRSVGISKIQTFLDCCQQHEITVLATWPNTLQIQNGNQRQLRDFFDSISDLYRRNQVPMLGQAEAAMYPLPLFYDSAYHLNDRGVKQRTAAFIRDLQPYLKSDVIKAIGT